MRARIRPKRKEIASAELLACYRGHGQIRGQDLARMLEEVGGSVKPPLMGKLYGLASACDLCLHDIIIRDQFRRNVQDALPEMVREKLKAVRTDEHVAAIRTVLRQLSIEL